MEVRWVEILAHLWHMSRMENEGNGNEDFSVFFYIINVFFLQWVNKKLLEWVEYCSICLDAELRYLSGTQGSLDHR